MESNFISFLKELNENSKNSITTLNKRKNNILPVYKRIYRNKIVKKEAFIEFLDNPSLLINCFKEVYIIDGFTINLALGVINSYEAYLNYKKDMVYIINIGKKYGINDLSPNKVKASAIKYGDFATIKIIDNFIKNNEKIEDLSKSACEIIEYMASRIISEYEDVMLMIDEEKKIQKVSKDALSKIRVHEKITPSEQSLLISYINDSELPSKEKNNFLSQLINYAKSFKEEYIPRAKEQIEESYQDSDVITSPFVFEEEKEENDIYYNYLLAIKSFDNYLDLSSFLNSLKEKFNMTIFLNKIIKFLSKSEEDILLKNYLNEYCKKIDKKEEEQPTKNIRVLYYDFIHDVNYIASDINIISEEYYKEVQKGIEYIKQDGALNKCEGISTINKVVKLRIGSVRITYKRLSNDTYIILGIFQKHDMKGRGIIETTKRRNKVFSHTSEKVIKSALNNETIMNNFDEKNEAFDSQINEFLKEKIK